MRRTFPDAGSQLAYGVSGDYLAHRVGAGVVFYTSSALTTLADVRARNADGSLGSAYAGSEVPVNSASMLPLFFGPDDNSDTLWYDRGGGTPEAVYARTDDRLDALESAVQAVQGLVVDASAAPYNADITGATSATAALNDALDAVSTAGGGTVSVPAGSRLLALGIAMKSNVRLDLTGAVVTKDAGAASTHVIDMAGTLTAVTGTLTADASPGTLNGAEARVLNMSTADAAKFAADDYVMLRDNTYAYSTLGRNQELNRVTASAASRTVADAAITSGLAVLTSATAAFTTADVGKNVAVAGAGPAGATLTARIITYTSATSVTLASNASTTVSGASATISAAVTLANRPLGTYAVAESAALLLADPVVNAQVVGGTLVIPAGTSGGGFYGSLCYESFVADTSVSGPNDDPGLVWSQSAYSHFRDCQVLDGQNAATGGFGYGISFFDSSHHCTARGCTTENVRENGMHDGARLCFYISCMANGHYDTGFNTHGSGVTRSGILHCTVTGSRGHGITVSFATAPAPDTDILVKGNLIESCGGAGVSAASPVGLECRRVEITGNTIRGWGYRQAAAGIVAQQCVEVRVAGNYLHGATANATRGVQLVSCTDVDVLGNEVADLPNGYALHWTSTDTLNIEQNVVRDVAASAVLRAADALSTAVLVRNNRSDQARAASISGLQGSETEYGNEWGTLGGAVYPAAYAAPNVQSFAANGTWTKPANGTLTRFQIWASGGGGGAGRRTASGTVGGGGSGGAGGGYTDMVYLTSELPATLAVTVGLGGAGAAAVTADSTNGSAGTAGGQSSVGSTLARATGGAGGAGGTTGGGGSAAAGQGLVAGGAGAAAAGSGGAGGAGNSGSGGPGGGAGGGIAAAPVFTAGGNGVGSTPWSGGTTAAGGATDGASGANGVATTVHTAGGAGAGGASSVLTTGGSGGNGGLYGAGGGGGGASLNGNNSGAGGAGADGFVRITTW